ncbi:MAG: hypothetical protein JRE29_14120 [Deltaproteobacteria bacterium]|nr:hypothetical protein [Deltaproteobacteria bacterium]
MIVLENELLEAKMMMKLTHEHFWGVLSIINGFLGLSIIFIYGAIAND